MNLKIKIYLGLMIALFVSLAFEIKAQSQFNLEGQWQLKSEICGLSPGNEISYFDSLVVTFKKSEDITLAGRSNGCDFLASGKYRYRNGELLWLLEDARSCKGVSIASSEVRKIEITNSNLITILGRSYFNEPCENGMVLGTWIRL